jgi:hypothetical protein
MAQHFQEHSIPMEVHRVHGVILGKNQAHGLALNRFK